MSSTITATDTKTTPTGEALIKAFESCLKAMKDRPGFFTTYYCPAGVLTYGWGTTRDDDPNLTPGAVFSQRQCDEAFAGSLAKYERHVYAQLGAAVSLRVTPMQRDALISWTYNCGGPANSQVWKAVREGRDKDVPELLARWNKGGGKVLPGLVRRRKAEGALYRGDLAEASKIAQTILPGSMPQSREIPTPTTTELARKTPGLAAATTTGASGTLAPTAGRDAGLTPVQIGAVVLVGLTVAVVCGALMLRKWDKLKEEWA